MHPCGGDDSADAMSDDHGFFRNQAVGFLEVVEKGIEIADVLHEPGRVAALAGGLAVAAGFPCIDRRVRHGEAGDDAVPTIRVLVATVEEDEKACRSLCVPGFVMKCEPVRGGEFKACAHGFL